MSRANSLMLAVIAAVAWVASPPARATEPPVGDSAMLRGAYRFGRTGWICVHLEGSPEQLGYQHGWLLSAEIADFLRVIKPYLEHSTRRDWGFFREASEKMLWPTIDTEYRQEIDGIVAGLKAKGVEADRWDLVALNANQELPYYYVPWLDKKEGKPPVGARAGQLQCVHRDGKLHQGRSDRHGAQCLDQLCGRHALEHRLRHQACCAARG